MFGLSNHTLALLQNYFRQQKDIRQVYVYGSRAMGTEEKGSDIVDKHLIAGLMGLMEGFSNDLIF